MIRELCSCGQTGVARGALEAAAHCQIATRGFMAHGFAVEDGSRPDLAARFGLKEVSQAGELRPIPANAKESDGTVWISPPPKTDIDAAFWATRKAVATYGHPFLIVPPRLKIEAAARLIAQWILRWEVTRLHVMGPRASLWPAGEERARRLTARTLQMLGTCKPRGELALVG